MAPWARLALMMVVSRSLPGPDIHVKWASAVELDVTAWVAYHLGSSAPPT